MSKSIWEMELERTNFPEEEKEKIRQRVQKFIETSRWFQENSWSLPPGIAVLFVAESTSILKSLGYIVNLDPGEMPS